MCPGYNYRLTGMELTLMQEEEAMGLGVRRKKPLMLCATPYVMPPPAAAPTMSASV
jgi:hypothetical protein